MPRRAWDDAWRRYTESVPLPAEGGIVTSKQRGAMASTWWSKRFVEVLESYGLGARMQRGRRYARGGQVLSLEVRAGVLVAQVQGSRRTPYLVTISLPAPSSRQWAAIDAAMAAKVGFTARLLAGEVPTDLEDVFRAADVALFPGSYSELRADCGCPDWESPCKHIAAVLYVFADQLDADPWLLLQWRGRTRDQVLGRLRATRAPVASWWPFAPGPLPVLPDRRPEITTPQDPAAVLDALEPPAIVVRGVPLLELLRPAYETITRTAEPDGTI
jgi:hypothetical protein